MANAIPAQCAHDLQSAEPPGLPAVASVQVLPLAYSGQDQGSKKTVLSQSLFLMNLESRRRLLQNPIDAENYFTRNRVKGRVGATIAGMMRVVETNNCAHHEYYATRFDNATVGSGSTRVDARAEK